MSLHDLPDQPLRVPGSGPEPWLWPGWRVSGSLLMGHSLRWDDDGHGDIYWHLIMTGPCSWTGSGLSCPPGISMVSDPGHCSLRVESVTSAHEGQWRCKAIPATKPFTGKEGACVISSSLYRVFNIYWRKIIANCLKNWSLRDFQSLLGAQQMWSIW